VFLQGSAGVVSFSIFNVGAKAVFHRRVFQINRNSIPLCPERHLSPALSPTSWRRGRREAKGFSRVSPGNYRFSQYEFFPRLLFRPSKNGFVFVRGLRRFGSKLLMGRVWVKMKMGSFGNILFCGGTKVRGVTPRIGWNRLAGSREPLHRSLLYLRRSLRDAVSRVELGAPGFGVFAESFTVRCADL